MTQILRGSGSTIAHNSGGSDVATRRAQATARFDNGFGQADEYEAGQIWLGRSAEEFGAVGFNDDRHIVTIAGSRAGKGTSAIIPNLCDYPGSIICIDPKGENATIAARRRGAGSAYCRGMGQKVVVLDPFGVADSDIETRASFNPLDLIDIDDPDASDLTNAIAEALIVEKDPRDAHWNESAKQLLSALMLYAKSACGPHEQHLGFVRDLLTLGFPMDADLALATDYGELKIITAEVPRQPTITYSGFDSVLKLMRKSPVPGVAGIAATLEEMGADERGSVLAAARRNTAFLDNNRMRTVLKRSSFELEELKTLKTGLSIFLCLPVKELTNHGRWLRLLVMLALDRIERLGQKPAASGHPVLFILDEFATLGFMRPLEVAVGFIAGYGVKLWCILQDLQQLQGLYQNSWATFLGNAGIIQCFANTDPPTLEYLSKRLGDVQMVQRAHSESQTRSISNSDSIEQSQTVGSSTQRSVDKSLTRLPRGLIFRGKKQSVSASKGISTSQDRSATTGHSSGTSVTQGQDQGYSEVISVVPLMRPDEIERAYNRDSGMQLVIVAGSYPISLRRTQYFKDGHFECKFDPSPAHPESTPPTLEQREYWAQQARDEEKRALAIAFDEKARTEAEVARRKRSKRRIGNVVVGTIAILIVINMIKNALHSPPDFSPDPPDQKKLSGPVPVTTKPAKAEAAAVVTVPMIVAAYEANVRAQADATATKAGMLTRGAAVTAVAHDNGFVKLTTADGTAGWVSERLLMTPSGYQRLQNATAENYIQQNGDRLVSDVAKQLQPLWSKVNEARTAMLQENDTEVETALAAVEHDRSVSISADSDASNWFSNNAQRAPDLDSAINESLAAIVADPSNADSLTINAMGLFKRRSYERLPGILSLLLPLAPRATNSWLLEAIVDALHDQQNVAVAEFKYAIKFSKDAAFTKKYLLRTASEDVDQRIAQAILLAVNAQAFSK